MDFRITPDCELPGPGTRVGPWVLLERFDSGSFGIVFRAERIGHPEAGPFAFKLAKGVEDARFPREVTLLQRLRHRSVPRFEDQGEYTSASGALYPYVVMEWAEGERLYRWGRERTSRQVLNVLQQLASALAAAHALGGLHRDVKGDNVVVGPEGRAVLLDWGAGTHPGAQPVTDSVLPPGTASYRTPEAVRWGWAHRMDGLTYQAGPEDDVYALGVMGYRLCTGAYPPLPEEASGPPLRLLAPRELATVSTGLDRLLLACLCEDRHARPSAAALAQAFKGAAAERNATHLITPTLTAAQTQKDARPGPPYAGGEWPAWATTAAVAMGGGLVAGFLVLLGVFCWRDGSRPTPRALHPEVAQLREEPLLDTPGGGVGTEALASVVPAPRAVMPIAALALPLPKQPFDGQRKPPCDPEYEVSALGACWFVSKKDPPCGSGAYELAGKCVRAAFDSPREPTTQQPR